MRAKQTFHTIIIPLAVITLIAISVSTVGTGTKPPVGEPPPDEPPQESPPPTTPPPQPELPAPTTPPSEVKEEEAEDPDAIDPPRLELKLTIDKRSDCEDWHWDVPLDVVVKCDGNEALSEAVAVCPYKPKVFVLDNKAYINTPQDERRDLRWSIELPDIKEMSKSCEERLCRHKEKEYSCKFYVEYHLRQLYRKDSWRIVYKKRWSTEKPKKFQFTLDDFDKDELKRRVQEMKDSGKHEGLSDEYLKKLLEQHGVTKVYQVEVKLKLICDCPNKSGVKSSEPPVEVPSTETKKKDLPNVKFGIGIGGSPERPGPIGGGQDD